MNNTLTAALALAGLLALALVGGAPAPADSGMPGPLTLWYEQPARTAMGEGLPLGNGRLGAMVFGGTAQERIQFNEDSLWTGDDNPSGNYDTMGGYQAFGDVNLTLPGHEAATGYRRSLDLGDAVARVTYRVGDITYTREYFASHADQVLVVRLTADHPRAYTGSFDLTDMHGGTGLSQSMMGVAGALSNGLRYEAQARVLGEGGVVTTVDDTHVSFQNCDSLTLLLACGTDYVMDAAKHWRGPDPHERVLGQLEAASAKPYSVLKAAHVRDYHALFGRVALDLGASLCRTPSAAHGPAQGVGYEGRRPRTGGPAVPVRALPAHLLLAARWPARQSARAME